MFFNAKNQKNMEYFYLTYNCYRPSHYVGEAADPDDAHEECQREAFLPLGVLAVGDCERQRKMNGPRNNPLEFHPDALAVRIFAEVLKFYNLKYYFRIDPGK